jgi:hypothetical protein
MAEPGVLEVELDLDGVLEPKLADAPIGSLQNHVATSDLAPQGLHPGTYQSKNSRGPPLPVGHNRTTPPCPSWIVDEWSGARCHLQWRPSPSSGISWIWGGPPLLDAALGTWNEELWAATIVGEVAEMGNSRTVGWQRRRWRPPTGTAMGGSTLARVREAEEWRRRARVWG